MSGFGDVAGGGPHAHARSRTTHSRLSLNVVAGAWEVVPQPRVRVLRDRLDTLPPHGSTPHVRSKVTTHVHARHHMHVHIRTHEPCPHGKQCARTLHAHKHRLATSRAADKKEDTHLRAQPRHTQHSTAQHNTTQHNTTQHNTTQHNTTQHNTTQHTVISTKHTAHCAQHTTRSAQASSAQTSSGQASRSPASRSPASTQHTQRISDLTERRHGQARLAGQG